MKRLLRLVAVGACIGCLMAACSDDDGGTTAPPEPQDADVAGTWTGQADMGMVVDITADFELDSSYALEAVTGTTPLFTSKGTYSVSGDQLYMAGDSCSAIDMQSGTFGPVACENDTVTVTGTTVNYDYNGIAITLTKQP